jgi:hypothetical protein
MFVKLHSKQSAKRARIRSTPVQQRLEEGYTQMVERGECLSISGLKVAAHVGSAPARAFLRSRGAPPQKGGPPEKPSTLYPTRRHEHKASLRENESFYEKQRGV